MVRSCFIVAAAVFFLNASSFAQDPHFSQFFEAPLLRNPSLAGLFDGDIRIQGVYRSQWGVYRRRMKQDLLTWNINNRSGKQMISSQRDYRCCTTVPAPQILQQPMYPAVNYHKALNADQSKFCRWDLWEAMCRNGSTALK